MLRQQGPSGYEWRRLHERLDRAIAEAARLYLQGLARRHARVDAQKWSDELDELRLGREPDYDMPGLALVYAQIHAPESRFCFRIAAFRTWRLVPNFGP